MKILLTGTTGYIGKRLLSLLLHQGHDVVCCVRDKSRFHVNDPNAGKITLLEIDFLEMPPLEQLPTGFDAAYYLIHSMTGSIRDFAGEEARTAENFREYMEFAGVEQVIYLGGIVNNPELSKHLQSRLNVENILKTGSYRTTVLRAGIIIGSGSASFEIIRDLVEKLPVMITPKWVLTRSQPISVRDIISCLSEVLLDERFYDNAYDVGGKDVLTYREMMLGYARVRGLKRHIITVPVMTPRLSSYWLYFVTSVPYHLAVNLVNSMKVEVLAKNNEIKELLNIDPIPYEDAVRNAFEKIEQNLVVSSWKDTLGGGTFSGHLNDYIQVPVNGCYKNTHSVEMARQRIDRVTNNIWSIGGNRGWYYATWLWKIRGWIDKMAGGVGLRRGRTNPGEIFPGDSLDFWRVILADKKHRRLLLYAEMKLPGEAWLEFRIDTGNEKYFLRQIATFRPKGLWGRIYWLLVSPFHMFIFRGMARNIVRF